MPKRPLTTKVSQGLIPTEDLDEALKSVPVIVQQYIKALEEENLKAQEQIAKFKAESVSQKNRASALEKKLAEVHDASEPWEDRLYRLRTKEHDTKEET